MTYFVIYRMVQGNWVLVRAKLSEEVCESELSKLIESAPEFAYKVSKVMVEDVMVIEPKQRLAAGRA